MRELLVFLASAAGLGGAVSMVLVATAPRSAVTPATFVVAMIITFGALSSARRLARQTRASG